MREKKNVSIATIIVVLLATTVTAVVTGCAGIFGLSDYSFDEAADSGGSETSTVDGPMTNPDASKDSSIDTGPPAATCTDKVMNGTETDVDCGGKDCPKCAVRKQCVLATDCVTPLACVELLCLSPNANDGVQDGDETDIDCGGPTAAACGTGKVCKGNTDCKDKICTTGACAAATSMDGVQNGTETDKDCGGGAPNPTCLVNAACINGPRDCQSSVCTNQLCKAPTSTDGYKNGSETDIDCGGGSAPPCNVMSACVNGMGARDCSSGVCTASKCVAANMNDGVKNGSETDIDCGGGSANPCANGQHCANGQGPRDCTSKVCTSTVCQAPTTTDGVKNGNETDKDCGGGGGNPLCANNLMCVPQVAPATGSRDCLSQICSAMNSCLAPTSTDLVKNGTETDVDCGGGGGTPACADGLACVPGAAPMTGAQDCKSKICTASKCIAASHTDGVLNGDETGVDCGGPTSNAPCPDGSACVIAAQDCLSSTCPANVCTNPKGNMTKDGSETDVDCGGRDPLTPRCAAMMACVGDTDCVAGTTCIMSVCN